MNMKKTLFIWLLSLLCFGLSLQAQNITQQLINIDGYITEEDSITPLDYATIQLYALPDSSFIKGTTSNLDGHFIFINSQLGVYFLKISSVGYNTRFFIFKLQIQRKLFILVNL